MTVAELMVRIGAETTGLQRGLRQAQAEIKGFQHIGEGMARTGESMSKYITLPLLVAAGASAKFSIDFQSAMENVHTQAGASQHEVDVLSQKVLDLASSGKVAQGPNELAQGLYHIESVGVRGAKAMDILKVASMGAATGQADLEDTVNALAGAWVTGIKGVQNMHQAMGILNATVGAGNMRMGDLAKSLASGVLPAARTAGLGLQDVAAAMALLTDESVPPAVAATRLRMSFSLLAAPSGAARKQLHSIGLGASEMAKAMQGPQGLIGALQLLKDHLDGLSHVKQEQILSRAFGGGRSGGTIMSLVNNLDRLKMKYEQIGKTAGHFDKDVAATQDKALFKLKASWAQLEAALIRAGAVIVPIVVSLAQHVASLATAFSHLSPSTQHWILVAAGIAAVVGPTLFMFGKMIVMVANVTAAYRALTGATAAAAAASAEGAAATEGGAAAAGAATGPVGLLAVAVLGLGAAYLHFRGDADRAASDAAKASQKVVTSTTRLTDTHSKLSQAIDDGGKSVKGWKIIMGQAGQVANHAAGILKNELNWAMDDQSKALLQRGLTKNVQNYAAQMQAVSAKARLAAHDTTDFGAATRAQYAHVAALAATSARLAAAINSIPSRKYVSLVLSVTENLKTEGLAPGMGADESSHTGPGGHYHPTSPKGPASGTGQGGGHTAGAAVVVHVHNPTFLTGDRKTARDLARHLAPELAKVVKV